MALVFEAFRNSGIFLPRRRCHDAQTWFRRNNAREKQRNTDSVLSLYTAGSRKRHRPRICHVWVFQLVWVIIRLPGEWQRPTTFNWGFCITRAGWFSPGFHSKGSGIQLAPHRKALCVAYIAVVSDKASPGVPLCLLLITLIKNKKKARTAGRRCPYTFENASTPRALRARTQPKPGGKCVLAGCRPRSFRAAARSKGLRTSNYLNLR